tara:strand:+ start:12272 stop:12481 length:210 start_codon:yes stop_codon:yes gene_type:complete
MAEVIINNKLKTHTNNLYECFEVYGSYGEHNFVISGEKDKGGYGVSFVEGEENFNKEEKDLIYNSVKNY